MDLEEYLFYEKRKDENFSMEKYAKKFGITLIHFYNILSKRSPPTQIAYRLWKESGGKIDIAKTIIDYHEYVEKNKFLKKDKGDSKKAKKIVEKKEK